MVWYDVVYNVPVMLVLLVVALVFLGWVILQNRKFKKQSNYNSVMSRSILNRS